MIVNGCAKFLISKTTGVELNKISTSVIKEIELKTIALKLVVDYGIFWVVGVLLTIFMTKLATLRYS